MSTLTVKSSRREEMIDITAEALKKLPEDADGVCVLFIQHTTCGLTVNENADPDVQSDMLGFLNRLIPQYEQHFKHFEHNSDAHIKSSLVGSSVTVPFEKGNASGTLAGNLSVRIRRPARAESDRENHMTAGYSGTPLANKLGIKEGMTVVIVEAPEDYRDLVAPLPPKVVLEQVEEGTLATARVSAFEADIVHLFTNTRDGLFHGLSDARNLIKQNGFIWVSWHKKAAKLPTEITEDTVREAAFPLGLVDVKVCAVDEKWSGLKLVIRRENRKS